MGWRKLTIQDGDLARCSELQRPRRHAELRPWGSFNAAASQGGCRSGLTAASRCQRLAGPPGGRALSNRTVQVQ